jgi:hypothetical protein
VTKLAVAPIVYYEAAATVGLARPPQIAVLADTISAAIERLADDERLYAQVDFDLRPSTGSLPSLTAKYREFLPQLPFHFEPHPLGQGDPLSSPAG